TGDRGIWLIASSAPVRVLPQGHPIKLGAEGIVWRNGPPGGRDQASSPGIERIISTIPCDWIVLPAHSAIEWEILDSSSQSPEQRGFTVFIKEARKAEPIEIPSGLFDVPIRTGLWPYGEESGAKRPGGSND
ncbi:MAG: hypothetical protein ACREKH_22000, partial [Candidatus Rokuibacteriota bacterium]